MPECSHSPSEFRRVLKIILRKNGAKGRRLIGTDNSDLLGGKEHPYSCIIEKHCYVNAFNEQKFFSYILSLRGGGNISEKTAGPWTCMMLHIACIKNVWTHFSSQFPKLKQGKKIHIYIRHRTIFEAQPKTVDLSPSHFYLCDHLQ
jgi:hypothetical protein